MPQKKFYSLRCLCFSLIAITTAIYVDAQSVALSIESCIKWDAGFFTATTSMDVKKAGLVMPSARIAGTERIVIELPLLIKEELFALPIDSSTTLGDAIAKDMISLDNLAKVIEDGHQGAAFFSNNMTILSIPHTSRLCDIGALFVHHKNAYLPNQPLEYKPTRKYTGILIDARGKLPVHGESVQEKLHPCLFPRIWDDSMELLYDRNTTEPDIARTQGIVTYTSAEKRETCINKTGDDPLKITARSIYGQNRTDIRIARDDALKILAEPANRELLRQGRIVIICDDDVLENRNLAPQKNERYYYTFSNIAAMIPPQLADDLTLADTPYGIRESMHNIQFKPDSAEFLKEESFRLDSIAANLKVAGNADFTVAGHAASVGKPEGEQRLSYERAKSFVKAMVERGLPEKAFTIRGYGSSSPLTNNDTPEGRARNRRVEITIRPKSE